MSVADRLLLQPANRAALGADITRAVLAVERTGSMESKPGVIVTVDDPRSALIESKLLTRPSQRDIGSPAANTLRPIDLLLDGIWYRLQQAKRTGQTVVLTLDHRGAVFMAEHDTPLSASRGQVTRAQFIRRQVFEAGRRRSAGYKLAFWALEVGRPMPQASMEEVSTRSEPDRDVSSIIERANRLKGVKVKGKELDAGQRRNAAVMIVQCETDNAGPKATLAACMGCIVEPGGFQGSGPFDNPLGGDASSVGIMQLLSMHLNGSTSTNGGRRDVALVVHLFLTKGFAGAGGAIEIARRNPGMSAGMVAANVLAPAAQYRGRYDQAGADARRVVAALGGTTGASTTATGGSYVKPFRFRRERGVNAWANTATLAEEVGRRRFITIPRRGSDVFVYAADEDLLKLRPQARLSMDAPYIVSRAYDLDYGKTIRSVQLQVLGDPFDADFAWGLPIILADDPLVDGTWLVWDVRESDGSPIVDLELRQPQPSKPEPASETVQRADTSDSSPDSTALNGTASGKFLARGKSISDRNYPYVWGGGHARVGVPDGGTGRDPGTGFDCCLAGETMVSGPDGPCRMDEIASGDRVWSWVDGRREAHVVTAAWMSKVQETYRVRLRNRSIIASGNHPVLRLVVAAPNRHVAGQGQTGQKWTTEWARVDELAPSDLIVIQDRCPDGGECAVFPDGSEVTTDSAWLLGVTVGDGHLSERHLHVCVYGELRERLEAVMSSISPAKPMRNDSHGVIFGDKRLVEQWTSMGLRVPGPKKRVPRDVWGWPQTLQRAFLDGYCDADGHRPSNVSRHGQRTYGSASRDLIAEVRELHIALGDAVSNVSINRRTSPIVIKGKTVKNALSLHTFTVWNGKRNGRAAIIYNHGRDLERYVADGFAFGRIIAIDAAGERPTYDIAVEGSHNFVADGVVVHNSGYIGACCYSAGMWPDGWGRSVPGSGTFASSWGEPGEGERITLWANGEHIFAEVKIPGQRVRWIDTSRQAGGPSGPHVRFGNRSTAGFTARRWPGV